MLVAKIMITLPRRLILILYFKKSISVCLVFISCRKICKTILFNFFAFYLFGGTRVDLFYIPIIELFLEIFLLMSNFQSKDSYSIFVHTVVSTRYSRHVKSMVITLFALTRLVAETKLPKCREQRN